MAGFGLETLPLALRYLGALFIWFGFIALSSSIVRVTAIYPSPTAWTLAMLTSFFVIAAALSALIIRRPRKLNRVER